MTLSRTEILPPNDLQSAAHFRAAYVAFVPNDTPLERILTPAFWANHWKAFTQQGQSNANEPRLGGIIEVMRKDMTLDVTLRVIGVGPGYVETRVIGEAYVDDSQMKRAAAENGDEAGLPDVPYGYKAYFTSKGDKPGHGARNLATGEIAVAGYRLKSDMLRALIALATKANGGTLPTAPAQQAAS